MQFSRIVLLLIVLALDGSSSFAQKGCQKPFKKWDEAYALKILTNSAWSKQMAIGSEFSAADRLRRVEGTDKGLAIGSNTSLAGNTRGLDRGVGVAGEKEIIHSYNVRLFSAMPIREAFVRLFQIRNKYDQMPDGQRKQLDVEFDKEGEGLALRETVDPLTVGFINRDGAAVSLVLVPLGVRHPSARVKMTDAQA